MDRLFYGRKNITMVIVTLVVLSTTVFAQESTSDSWNKAQAEM
jgi:hypothetical protein